MITNQGAPSPAEEVSSQVVRNDRSLLSSRGGDPNSAERVIGAYTASAGRGHGGAEEAFGAAVRTYLACYPGTHPDAAARIVAEIISHRL